MTHFSYKNYIIPIFLQLTITGFGMLFTDALGMVNMALIHLIPVLVIAVYGDMKATMLITTISVILFDVLYVPPKCSFSVHDLLYVWSFILFYAVGYIITFQAIRLRSNAIKDILLNTLSHDLKTPLASILGNAAILLKEKSISEADKEEIAHQIKRSGIQMNRLIQTLLDSARIQNSKAFMRYEWCDIQDIIGIALQEFNRDDKGIRIEIDHDLPLYWGDEALLIRLMVNLIDNAMKYSGYSSSPIRISVTMQTSEIIITVFNPSDPIPKTDLRDMFEKFYRLDSAGDIKGSGIGLSICKEIVDAHNGHIEAYNAEGGIEVRVALPIEKLYTSNKEYLS
ncbi:MAG TPA: PAS domain-containing sensor histidine kinase [Epsilonproteobacteria bacterium]|nr:PAS domain-containing sensor histidine kinase [Campylobacterota bacterium]